MIKKLLSTPTTRLLAGILACVLSITLLYFSMPPYGIWPLMLVGFSPMLLAQYRLLPGRVSALAPALAVSFFIFLYIAGTFGSMLLEAPTLWLILPAVMLVVFFSESGSRVFHERTGYRLFALEGAVAWVGFEMIRNLIPFIGTGGFVGYAYYTSPWLIQPVSIFGMLGLDLLSMLAAYSLGLGTIALYDRWLGASPNPVPPRQARAWLAGAGGLAAAWGIASLVIYFSPAPGATLSAAAIQPGRLGDFEHNALLTRQASGSQAQLVVWPEGAMATDPGEAPSEVPALASEMGAYLVTGVAMRTPAGLRNEAMTFSPAGELLGVYGKDHPLVMLGESSISRGSYPVYQLPGGVVGTIICFDLEFSDTTRLLAGKGASLIAAPSNDWPALATRQLAYVIFRAVENRVSILKADTAYDSLAVDWRGTLVEEQISPFPSQGVMVARLAFGPGGAPYTALGDWVGWLCLAGMLVILIANPLMLK